MMESNPNTGWHFKDVLQAILETGAEPWHIRAIIKTILEWGLSRHALAETLDQFGVSCVSYYKADLLDLMITYANIILDDHYISEEEYRYFGLLKILFRIQEGDFYKHRYHQLQNIFESHIQHIMADGKVDLEEALQTVDLESMFGLSNDQFEQLEKSITFKLSGI